MKPLLLAIALGAALSGTASAQSWPTKAVNIVVPYPPGGFTDVVARAIALQLQPLIGQAVVVENKTGASGRIGLEQVLRAAPDGHTIGLVVPALLSLLPITDEKYGDLAKQYTPITIAVETYFGFAVNPEKTKAATFLDFVKSPRAQNKELFYSTPGIGTSYQFWSEAILSEAGLTATHVPQRGEAPATSELMNGQVDFTLVTGAGKGFAEAGKIKVLAVSAPKGWDIYSGAPSLGDVGMKQSVAAGWLGFAGPAGMPKELTEKVNAAFVKAMQHPDVVKLLNNQGYTVVASAPDKIAPTVAREQEIFGRLIKSGRVKLEQN